MFVKELKPRSNFDFLELEIVSKDEPREFSNAFSSGRVCNAKAKDSNGDEITVTLWNEQIEQVNEGNKIKIENGWCSEFRGQIQVSTGKFGKLIVVDEKE